MNLFVRLRISKQDKIAANVAQHIRAVRAAEALDRRTHFKRTDSFSFPGLPAHRQPAAPTLSAAAAAPIPSRTEHVACQTSYDLLEALLPSLRKRALRSAEQEEVVAHRSHAVRRQPPQRSHRVEVEYKPEAAAELPDYELEDLMSMKRSKALQLLGKKSQYNKLQAIIGETTPQHEGVSETSFSPAISQDSLIDATSSIVEESASTGSDDTPGGGGAVYKNIIINLGGGSAHDRSRLLSASQSAATSSANLSLPSATGSRSQENVGAPDVCKWSSPNGNPRRMEN